MGVKLRFFLALMLILPRFHCINWQGTGVMAPEMMSAIWNYINSNFDSTLTSDAIFSEISPLEVFAEGLSTDLNNRFHRAWNVMVIYDGAKGLNLDTILYGYAFRDHWFWSNGHPMTDQCFMSFVIWKDYNCNTYITYNPVVHDPTNYDSSVKTPLQDFISSQKTSWNFSDVWGTAFSFVDNLSKLDFQSDAFSIVFSQSYAANFFAYVCAEKYLKKTGVASNGIQTGGSSNTWASFFLFQMRQMKT